MSLMPSEIRSKGGTDELGARLTAIGSWQARGSWDEPVPMRAPADPRVPADMRWASRHPAWNGSAGSTRGSASRRVDPATAHRTAWERVHADQGGGQLGRERIEILRRMPVNPPTDSDPELRYRTDFRNRRHQRPGIDGELPKSSSACDAIVCGLAQTSLREIIF